MKKSNRHVSHLGGLGSGDGLSRKLSQDMSKPKISGGGFEGTADSNFSSNIGKLRVHIDDDDSLMFPENEDFELAREKDTIRSKIPFDGRYKMRESKKSKKSLIDLFDDKYFEEEENSTHFKHFDTNKNLPEKMFEKFEDEAIEKDFNYNRNFEPPTQKASVLSINKLNKSIKKEAFNQIKESFKRKGMKLVLKEKVGCNECGAMYEACMCESPDLVEGAQCEGCGMMESSCMCEQQVVDELNTLASGGIAGYQTRLSTPKNMKKHKAKMLPTGYKYR